MTLSNSNHKPILLLSLLIASWIAALLIESSGPSLPILGEVRHLDKLAHFLAFSCLGLMVCALSFKLNPKPEIPLLSIPLLFVTSFGIIDESYQMLIPGRASELLDLLADVCGALFAIILANRVARLMRANNPIGAD
jgi:VanZ family protein